MTELIHERDVTRGLAAKQVASPQEYQWLSEMRFYFNAEEENPLGCTGAASRPRRRRGV